MAHEQGQLFCVNCQRHTLHTRITHDTNHLAHAIVTLFLCCSWFPVWLIVDISNGRNNARIPYNCNSCGQPFGALSPAAIAAQQAARSAALASVKGGVAPSLSALVAATRTAIASLGAGVCSFSKTALPVVKSLPKRADDTLKTIAGEGNDVLHGFLRFLSVGLAVFLFGVGGMLLFGWLWG